MKKFIIILLILTTACFGLLRKFEDDKTERWYQGYGDEDDGLTLTRSNKFGIATPTPSYELDIIGTIQATTARLTNLYSTNLEADLDGTGFDLTIADIDASGTITTDALVVSDLTATTINIDEANITNLSATNLESDMDGTGYDLIIEDIAAGGTVTADTKLYSALVECTNLKATNLERGLDGTGFSITANLFTDSVAIITGGVGSGFTNFTSVTINTTEANITNLLATNLEADIDATGYDISAIQDIEASGVVTAGYFVGEGSDITSLNATQLKSGTVPDARITGEYTFTTLNITDLLATNLEADIDATGFDITAIVDINASGTVTAGIIAVGDTSGGNYAHFESDGSFILTGNATAWEDLRVPVSQIKRLGFTDPDWEKFQETAGGSTGVYTLAFDKTTDQEIYFTVQIPHSWKLGTDLEPHVHWSPSDTTTGNVNWTLEYSIAELAGTFGNTVTMSVLDAGNGVAKQHQLADLGMIDMSSYTSSANVSTMIICRLYRDVSLNDDYDNDAYLHEIDFHFQVDSLGSRDENYN